MEMFKARMGLDMVHVPYKGTAGALQDTVAGNINVMFDIVGPLMPQVTAGNIKALGLAAKEPIPAAPGVKTIIEQGVPDFVSGTWAGIIAPAGSPKEIVDRVAAEAKKALADPVTIQRLADQGIVAVGSTPDEFRAFVADEIARWAKVIKDGEHQGGGVSGVPERRHLILRLRAKRGLEGWQHAAAYVAILRDARLRGAPQDEVP